MKKALSSILLLSIMLLSTLLVGTTFATPDEKTSVIVGFRGLPDAALIHAHGGDIIYQYSIIPAIACSLPSQAIDGLKHNPNVVYIEQDFEVTALEYNNYPKEDWGITQIGANTLSPTDEGAGVKVAVIDTGINRQHEDLKDRYVGGYDFVNRDSDPSDDNGHGSHCAGIIAASLNNIAVVGVAPMAQIYAYKVLNSQGSGTISNIILGIQRAVADQVDVISMSLGSTSYSQGLYDACVAATSYPNNIVVVAAAGNSGNTATGSTVNYPAKFGCVIAVGATDVNDNLATFSSTGPEVDVVAPGVSILSDYKDVTPNDGMNRDVVYMSGTSMACPHVAGTAALLLSINPTFTPARVQEILQTTAIDRGIDGFDNYYGYGRINAAAAVASITTTPFLTVVINNPKPCSEVSGQTNIQADIANPNGPVTATYSINSGPTTSMAINLENGFYKAEATYNTAQLINGKNYITVIATDGTTTATNTIYVTTNNPVPTLDLTAKTDKTTSYTRGQTATITIRVQSAGSAISGAAVTIVIQPPRGSASSMSGTTNTQGDATFKYPTSIRSSTGTYQVTATATKTGFTQGTLTPALTFIVK